MKYQSELLNKDSTRNDITMTAMKVAMQAKPALKRFMNYSVSPKRLANLRVKSSIERQYLEDYILSSEKAESHPVGSPSVVQFLSKDQDSRTQILNKLQKEKDRYNAEKRKRH